MNLGERGRRWLFGLGVAVLLVQGGSFLLLWGEPTTSYWSGGDVRFGDLAKHYGAALFWREGRAKELYQGGALGEWLDKLQREGKERKAAEGAARFNYVYAPVVAAAAAWATWSYPVWALLWFGISLGLWWAVLLVLRGQLSWSWSDGVVWVWAAGFPPAYYGLILGQNHLLTLAVIVGAGAVLQAGRSVVAGLILSCLFYKPQWSVYLAVMMFLFGHRRVGIGWLAGTMLWLGFTWAISGSELMRLWLGALGGMESGAQNQVGNLNQTWRGLLSTVVQGLPGGVATGLAGLMWAGGTLSLMRWRGSIPVEVRRVDDLWLASAFGVFAMPYVMHYDALMFLPLWLRSALGGGPVWATVGVVVAGWLSINFWDFRVAFMAPVWTLLFFGLIVGLGKRRAGHGR